MINKIVKTREALYRGRKTTLQMLTACGLLVGAFGMQSCEKDILTGQPEWLGNSIYERLQEGIEVDGQKKSFNTTLRLIDDLGYKSTLSMTGSKTVFVASDDDYNAWFQNNAWGVSSYEQLTLEQKKQLFNGSMINNAYLLELMSNTPASSEASDPEKGQCMRRATSASVWDNVPVVKVEDFPRNDSLPEDPVNTAWERMREAGRDIHVLKDATTAPMIHFLPEFMNKNNITDHDLAVISNGASESVKDSWINGKKVISREQTCKNGYVYVVSGVMESNMSMAEIIHNNPQTKTWSKLLNRFSVPVTMNKATQSEFWRLYPQYENVDSIYNLAYLNESLNRPIQTVNGVDPLNQTLLKFDPGWNQYRADELLMGNDAAVMVVPTDEALDKWFDSGAGSALKKKFGSWDAIDLQTLVKLINVNMFGSFVSSVPSKFSSMLDDAQRPFGMKEDNIVKTYMGCNGIVYVVNDVFSPSEYSSVLYPALIEGSSDGAVKGAFATIYKALQGRVEGGVVSDYDKDFTPYLSAMDSRFSIILPYSVQPSVSTSTKETVIRYIDPCSYGLSKQYMYEFYIGSTGAVNAYAYPCTVAEDGMITISSVDMILRKQVDLKIAANRLFDYIDNTTIVEDIVPGKEFYRTKAGSVIHAFTENGVRQFQGGFQMETGEKIQCLEANVFNMNNGTTYGICEDADADKTHVGVPLTASKTVYELLKAEKEKGGDHMFFDLIFNQPSQCKEVKALYSSKNASYYCTNTGSNYNMTVFDNYNYTVYVPSDAEMKKLNEQHILPTWDDYMEAQTPEEQLEIATRIQNFVRYHIQDNSIFVGGGDAQTGLYESAKMNPETKRFYTFNIKSSGNNLSVVDNMGVEHKILPAFYNKPCREMWIKLGSGTGGVTTVNCYQSTIESASNVVVHKVEKPLFYDAAQLTDWRNR